MKQNVHQILDEVRKGERKAYAWGAGYMFNACRDLHGLPLHAMIHTAPDRAGTRVRGLPVVGPEVLLKADAANTLVIGYSAQYREEIREFCSKVPGLALIFFDDPTLLDRDRMSELVTCLRDAGQSGVLKGYQVRMLKEALAQSDPAPTAVPELETGYAFFGEFFRDIWRALSRQVHFIFQENVSGDMIEFGTYTGTTASYLAAAMADAMNRPSLFEHELPPERRLHLYDSFQGLPKITSDVDIAAGWKEGRYRDKSAAELRVVVEKYLPSHLIEIHEGWFRDTLSQIPKSQKFSLVHIDCDIYESTIEVLDYLFANQHLSDGCAIFFDDWNCGLASPDLGERRAWGEIVGKYSFRYTDCGNYSAYGNKFLIHTESRFSRG